MVLASEPKPSSTKKQVVIRGCCHLCVSLRESGGSLSAPSLGGAVLDLGHLRTEDGLPDVLALGRTMKASSAPRLAWEVCFPI